MNNSINDINKINDQKKKCGYNVFSQKTLTSWCQTRSTISDHNVTVKYDIILDSNLISFLLIIFEYKNRKII